MQKSKPPSAASIHEAALHAACYRRYRGPCRLYPFPGSRCSASRATAIYESLQDLILFPYIGRRQKAEHVRKLVTRKYPYLIYYTVDADAEEIVILNVKHPAREREHEDA
jgi:plasmid stabilization system protein ParE